MGRRKIEIQPIAQERNRSVTFAKRKNGLFKKAYELGVLCSVDVAVIIFETRPGQEPKLHQYCSSDIRSIIQRHVQHQGDKDLKGPNDFSGSGAAATFDYGDEDEGAQDDDADEEDQARRSSKKTNRSGLSLPDPEETKDSEGGQLPSGPPLGYVGAGIYGPHVPPPPPMHSAGQIDPNMSGIGSLMPVSNDRVSSMRESDTRLSKRKRTLDSMDPGGRSPALRAGGRDLLNFPSAPGPQHPNQQERFYPEMRPPHVEHSPNPGSYPYHHPQNTQHQGFNPHPNYAPMFSAFAPQPFMPLQTDFGPARGHISSDRDVDPAHAAGGYGGPAAPREGKFSGPQYDPSLFHPQNAMMPPRHSPQGINIDPRIHRGSETQGGEQSPIDPSIADRGRQDLQLGGRIAPSGNGDASAGIEWPSYRHGSMQASASHSPRFDGSFRSHGGPVVPSQDSAGRSNAKDGWLDALSAADTGSGHGGASTSRPGTSSDTSTRSRSRATRAGSETGVGKFESGKAEGKKETGGVKGERSD